MPYERSLDLPITVVQPICRHLLSKSMYLSGTREVSSSGAGHCWCNRTQDLRGPDSQLVDRQACNSNRTCYESVL